MIKEYFGTIAYLATGLYLSFHLLGILRRQPRSMLVFFSLLAAVSIVFSNLYWITYDLMRPGVRMPFAANEISEGAIFLLFVSALMSAVRVKLRDALPLVLLTMAFTLANVLFWIGWSGEWFQDIFTGLVLGYFLCIIAAALKKENACSRHEWWGIGILSAVLVLGQTGTFLAPKPVRHPLDLACYACMQIGAIFFFILRFRAGRAGKNPETVLILSFAFFAWMSVSMYMSAGIFYVAAELELCLSLLLLLTAIRKKEGFA